MTIPFSRYVEIKDNYCLNYIGKDKHVLKKLLEARQYIENELRDIKIFIACDDSLKDVVQGRKNVILASKLVSYKDKMICFRNLEEKQDIKSLLSESNIAYPDDF